MSTRIAVAALLLTMSLSPTRAHADGSRTVRGPAAQQPRRSLRTRLANGFNRLRLPVTRRMAMVSTAMGAAAMALHSKAALAMEPGTLEQITQTWQTMGTPGKAAVATAAIAIPAAIVGGRIYYKRSRAVADAWTGSTGRKRFAEAEQSSDPAFLAGLHLDSKKALAAAEAHETNAGRGQDKKAIKQATLERAFEGLTHFYVKFKTNTVAVKPERRAGKKPPSQWKRELTARASEATKLGHEGFLAPQLTELSQELADQDRLYTQYEDSVARFKQATPSFFAKEMKRDLAQVTTIAKSFVEEQKTERALHRTVLTQMRGRVSDRLAKGSVEFNDKRARFRRLDGLYVGQLEPVKTLASRIDSDLSDIESARAQQAAMLALAATQTRVAVPKQVPDGTDANGHTKYRSEIQYEDHSGPTRALAAAAAMQAQSAASSANSRLSELNGKLALLKNDPVLKQEGLAHNARQTTTHANGGTFGALGAFFLPPMVSLIGNLFDNSSTARSSFARTKAEIDGLVNEVGRRRKDVRGWVDGRIDQRLQQDIQLAKQAAPIAA